MNRVNIQVPQPLAMQCVNDVKETVTVAIVPVKIVQANAFTTQITWSCSRGFKCKCQECIYAYRSEQR